MIDLKEWDLLFYRWDSFFSFFIRIGEVLRYGNFKHFFNAFTHVAQVVYNRELDYLMRYDAMEWLKTGFRDKVGKAYVFRFKDPLTARELMLWRQYLLARKWSWYDLKWAVMTNFTGREDIFGDYCSEIAKNALFVAGRMKDDRQVTPYGLYTKLRKKLDFIWIMI